MKKFLIICVLTLFFYSIAGATTMDFKTFKLGNGAKIKYLYRDSIPIVYVSVLIPASPLDESKPSVAYLTAHLLTHGTKTMTAQQIEDKIDFLAISIDKKITHDYTMLTLATTKRHLKEALNLFFDVLMNPTFPEEELKKELARVEKSLKQLEEDPSYIAYKTFIKQLFNKHPYGRPVEGEPEELRNITRHDILDFYKKFYNPQAMVFSVVGSIDERELKELIEKPISLWQGSLYNRIVNPPSFKERNEPLKIYVKRQDLTQSTVVLGFEGISRQDPDFYALSVMNYILGGGGLTSRLAKQVREERGLAYSVYSTFSPYLMPGAFYVEVKTKKENTQDVIKLIIEEIKKMKEKEVTDEELKEAKSFLTGSFPLRIDTMKKISEFLPVIDFYGLGDNYITKYPEYIEKVTKEDIKRVTQRILNTQGYIVVIVGKDL
ncbi:pitrilysin family protein [Thermodesulfovibrio sp. 3907-1M]|uniref:Pitrilysin family protein n=1 Tax=Thermodesulfovibrio autotrophicus TaxID=3118333 RepID=A0AAU8GTX5_9BACT